LPTHRFLHITTSIYQKHFFHYKTKISPKKRKKKTAEGKHETHIHCGQQNKTTMRTKEQRTTKSINTVGNSGVDLREENFAGVRVPGGGPLEGYRHFIAVIGVRGCAAFRQYVDGAGSLSERAQPPARCHFSRLDEEALECGAAYRHCKQNTIK